MCCVAEGQPQNLLLKDIGQGGRGRGEKGWKTRKWEVTEERGKAMRETGCTRRKKANIVVLIMQTKRRD